MQAGPAVELSDSNGFLLKEWILSSSMKLFVNICVQVASLFFFFFFFFFNLVIYKTWLQYLIYMALEDQLEISFFPYLTLYTRLF